jgi:hypothetical protein
MKQRTWMLRVDKVLTFGLLSEWEEKKVKPFVADKVKVLCESFMLSVFMIKTLVSNVPWIVSIDVNACHANVMNCFMMFGMNSVHWVTWETRFLCKIHFREKLGWRNLLIAKILQIAKSLQQHFANSQRGVKFSAFPKAVSSSIRSAVAIGGRFCSLLRNKDSL